MSVGFTTDKGTVDQRAGSLAWQLRSTLDQIQLMKAWLDAQADVVLTNLGYATADITLLRAAYTDLDNLRKVAHGLQAQPGASDFFFNAGKLTGLQ
jgi:hypothetical protein